jgi:hypothetical protein
MDGMAREMEEKWCIRGVFMGDKKKKNGEGIEEDPAQNDNHTKCIS